MTLSFDTNLLETVSQTRRNKEEESESEQRHKCVSIFRINKKKGILKGGLLK